MAYELVRRSVLIIDFQDRNLPPDIRSALDKIAMDYEWGNDGIHEYVLGYEEEEEDEDNAFIRWLKENGVSDTEVVYINYWW